jgi:putative membrane protein
VADAERDPPRFKVVPTPETHFSWLRTRLSVERTLMSAVRTAVSLIAFGFTLFQFLNQLSRVPGALPPRHQDGPWYLGLTLIAAGILGLLIGIYEYRKMLGYLWSQEYRPIAGIERTPWHTPTFFLSVLLVLVGLFAFWSVWARI